MSVAEILDSMDYGPAPESREIVDAWLAGLKPTTRLFIGGQWRQAKSKSSFETTNPASGEVLATLAEASDADVGSAVNAARAAQPGWAALSGHERARYLYAIARLIQKHARFISVLETLDNGKPIRESRDIDIPLAARHFYHHAGWAQLSDTELAGHEPIGVVGQIIPWNFPTLMLAWKIAPALAAGNTVVLKPAEFTSLTALRFAQLCQEAGLPDGVVNIVTGAAATGSLIVSHPEIDKIAFTGSTEVGRLIRRETAGSGKKLSLELGGKSPFIVFDDADLDSAVEGLVDAIWFNQGEVCCAGSRLLVQESIGERFLDKVRDRMAKLRLGDPLDKSIDVGAIIDESQRRTIDALVKRGVEEGGTVWQPDIKLPEHGCFYPPTLLTDVSPVSTVCQEEIFGPVLVSMTFRTPAEAVEIANNTRYGLAASVWSENINLALGVAPAIKAGVIWINCTNQFDAACGFGGYRESGFGREGGLEGMQEYLKPIPRKKPPVLKVKKAGEFSKDTQIDLPSVDRTAKMYIGGVQTRPDSGYSRQVVGEDGRLYGHVGDGNRKDIRNAVEAARKAEGWGRHSAHGRAQILYYLAENLSVRRDEFQKRLRALCGVTAKNAAREVDGAISRLFSYAAWADKFDGAVHAPPLRSVAIAMHEPVGIVGIACPDDAPLLSFISLVAPAIAMGCRVVAIPSELFPLVATDFYQVIETSDLPAGVVNIVTGDRDALVGVLAEHDQVDAVWYVGPLEGSEMVERASAANLKRTWVNEGMARDWFDDSQGEGREFLHHATQVKNIWVPYGE